jgi:DNA-binding Xre family transcriptional regulator
MLNDASPPDDPALIELLQMPPCNERGGFVTIKGDRVRTQREARGLSQKDLCDRAGLSQPKLSAIECGRQKSVPPEDLTRLARQLRVRARWLSGHEMDPVTRPSPVEPRVTAPSSVTPVRTTPVVVLDSRQPLSAPRIPTQSETPVPRTAPSPDPVVAPLEAMFMAVRAEYERTTAAAAARADRLEVALAEGITGVEGLLAALRDALAKHRAALREDAVGGLMARLNGTPPNTPSDTSTNVLLEAVAALERRTRDLSETVLGVLGSTAPSVPSTSSKAPPPSPPAPPVVAKTPPPEPPAPVLISVPIEKPAATASPPSSAVSSQTKALVTAALTPPTLPKAKTRIALVGGSKTPGGLEEISRTYPDCTFEWIPVYKHASVDTTARTIRNGVYSGVVVIAGYISRISSNAIVLAAKASSTPIITSDKDTALQLGGAVKRLLNGGAVKRLLNGASSRA